MPSYSVPWTFWRITELHEYILLIVLSYLIQEECARKLSYTENGYTVLNQSKMDVEFLIINHKHVARLKWNPPAGTVDNVTFLCPFT